MENIKQILIRRDGLNEVEATNLITSAKEQMAEYLAYNDIDSAYDICAEFFNLEPDYLDELL